MKRRPSSRLLILPEETQPDKDPTRAKEPGFQIRIHFIRIRIQHFRLTTDPDPDPGFLTKNWKKFTAEKKIIFKNQKLQFTYL